VLEQLRVRAPNAVAEAATGVGARARRVRLEVAIAVVAHRSQLGERVLYVFRADFFVLDRGVRRVSKAVTVRAAVPAAACFSVAFAVKTGIRFSRSLVPTCGTSDALEPAYRGL
jgi:hypothetical protein